MLIQHFLENSAKRFPNKIALICEDHRLTYMEINNMADQLAYSLIDMGIKRHDRVVIFLDNSVESVISLFGILKAGAIFIILNPTMKSKKLNYILKDSGAIVMITHINKGHIVKEALAYMTYLEHVIWCGKDISHKIPQFKIQNSKFKTFCTWSSLFDGTSSVIPPEKCIDIDLASIIYTSGSTGEPKGVMSAHYNMVAAAKSITQYLKNVENDIILNVLPLSFDYGLYQVLMSFLFGGTVILERSFVYPYKVLERLIQEGATGFPVVPTMVAILLEMGDVSKFDFSSLRYITNTAAALPLIYIRKLQAILPHVKIYSMYGLTECKRVSYLPPHQLDKRPESVGIPIPNEEVFIVNNKGEIVGTDEVGELVVRGTNVMQGYWNDPEETARVFRTGSYRGETFLYTGDLFKKDEAGYLYFISRKDNMIKTKGERVSPKEIENTLHEIEGVVETAVIGVPDEIFGQAIKALIVTRNQSELTEKQIMKYCMKNLEPFMVPKYVEFRNALSKSTSGKIDKKQLK